MAEDRSMEFLDYLVLLVKNKKLIIITVILSLFISYGFIYYFFAEEFEANATILPVDQTSLTPFASIMKDFSKLPLNISGKSQNSNYYNTIIYSRTNLEKIADKFGLQKDYKIPLKSDLLKKIAKNITTSENEDGAFLISVRSNSPKKAADITNYLITQLNESVINLNTEKTHENRVYLGQRYDEISGNLKKAEDSLKLFQENSGFLEAEEQNKAIIENYTRLESDLAAKEIEYSVVQKIYGENTQQTQNAKISLDEFKKKVEQIKSGKSGNAFLQSINSLPQKTFQYVRLYREVKIYEAMLEYIIPLYENSKFEEKKNIPIFQVVDYAVPPEKRVAPQRTLLSILITIGVLAFVMLYILINDSLKKTENRKLIYLKKNLFRFKDA